MLKNLFIKQQEYENWANNLVIKSIMDSNNPNERVFELISQIVIVHQNWLQKIKKEQPYYKPWEKLTLDDCLKLSNENFNSDVTYISSLKDKDFEEFILFPFMAKPSKIAIQDLLTHLVNHASYHRGQIIALLKNKLDILPLTTYIAFASQEV